MDLAIKPHLSERINYRLLVFLAVVLAPVGYMLYLFAQSRVTGGIIDRGSYLEVDLKAMSSFEMDQIDGNDNQIPSRFRSLNGKRVMAIGEMYQPYAVSGRITEFDLVYSIAKCCVTSSPKIQHFVKCTVPPGREARYYGGLVKVTGTLYVGVQKSGGRVSSVYRLEVESVRPIS